jgi:hypothetical protein
VAITDDPRLPDKFCALEEATEFNPCGLGRTTECTDPMICLLLDTTAFIGICVTICTHANNGADECQAGQDCAGGILTGEEEGICGSREARGAACDILTGAGCELVDVCTPDDLANPSSAAMSCRQMCTATDQTCDSGTCTQIGTTGDFYACY